MTKTLPANGWALRRSACNSTEADVTYSERPSSPPKQPRSRAAEHRFLAPTVGKKFYRAAYALSDAENKKIKKAHADYSVSVGFRRTGSTRYTWDPPEGCGKDMRCVMDVIARRNQPNIEPLFILRKTRPSMKTMINGPRRL